MDLRPVGAAAGRKDGADWISDTPRTSSSGGVFAGIPVTGKEFRVPVVITYNLENDQIKRARIYFEVPALMEELGVTAGQSQSA